jgi:hypothetical protein
MAHGRVVRVFRLRREADRRAGYGDGLSMKKVQVSVSDEDNKIIVRVKGCDDALMVMSAQQAREMAALFIDGAEMAEQRTKEA